MRSKLRTKAHLCQFLFLRLFRGQVIQFFGIFLIKLRRVRQIIYKFLTVLTTCAIPVLIHLKIFLQAIRKWISRGIYIIFFWDCSIDFLQDIFLYSYHLLVFIHYNKPWHHRAPKESLERLSKSPIAGLMDAMWGRYTEISLGLSCFSVHFWGHFAGP